MCASRPKVFTDPPDLSVNFFEDDEIVLAISWKKKNKRNALVFLCNFPIGRSWTRNEADTRMTHSPFVASSISRAYRSLIIRKQR